MDRYSQNAFLDRVKRKSGSVKSVNSSKVALIHFTRFCDSVYDKTPEVVVSELKISIKDDSELLYQFIDNVVSYLSNVTKARSKIPNQKLSVEAINGDISIIKQFLRHSGILIDTNMEKQFVTLPKQIKERVEPVLLHELQMIVNHANKKRKLLYLVLLSSGMRIGECLKIKKGHIKFEKDLIQISISGKNAKKYQLENYEKIKEYQKSYGPIKNRARRELHFKNRKLVIRHYSNETNKCVCCGESEYKFLAIDHIQGRKSMNHDRTIGAHRLVTWIIKNDYPKGFQVLCHNCNFGKSMLGICPHEVK